MSSYNTSDLTDEHPRVDHIVLNRRFDASCDSEDTRVGAFARQYLRAGPCCPVPEEVTVVARLVAAHLLRPAAPGRLQVSGHSGQQHEFALLARFTVGRNVSCLAFRLVESKTLPAKSFDSLYLAFNWFKPEGLSDYVRLGSSLLWNNSVVSDAVLGSLYEDLSSKFLANSEFLLFLKSRLSAFHMNAQGLDRTCTYLHICGFSLGAGVAFGLAYKLRQMSPHLRIRVTGFGPTKIGSWKLRKWCEANLDPASLSVILATSETPALQTQTSLIGCRATACKRPERIQFVPRNLSLTYDPACRIPFEKDDFGTQPFATILHDGQMRPMASHDRWALLESDKHRVSTFVSQLLNLVTRMTPFDEPTDRLFTKMHDIAHYLSAMTQSEGAPLIE